MTRGVLILFVCLGIIPRLAYCDDTEIKKEVNAKVTHLAALMGDAYSQEYPSYRGIQILRNDKDEIVVAVSIFTIEGLQGGTNYTQFMAAFAALSPAAEDHPMRMNLLDVMAVGGKGLRILEFKKMIIKRMGRNIGVTVPTLEYGPNDAMCCPSIEAEAQFVFQPHVGGRIREISRK